jgi:hypothetical protein
MELLAHRVYSELNYDVNFWLDQVPVCLGMFGVGQTLILVERQILKTESMELSRSTLDFSKLLVVLPGFRPGRDDVVVLKRNEHLLKKGFSSIESFLNKGVEKGKMTAEGKNNVLKKIRGTGDYREFRSSDLVVQAMQENLEVKPIVYEELDKRCPSHAILGTNTSSLSIIDIASATRRPERALGCIL